MISMLLSLPQEECILTKHLFSDGILQWLSRKCLILALPPAARTMVFLEILLCSNTFSVVKLTLIVMVSRAHLLVPALMHPLTSSSGLVLVLVQTYSPSGDYSTSIANVGAKAVRDEIRHMRNQVYEMLCASVYGQVRS